ncbi:MAG: glycosyltransferase, partial [Candidatus Cloacimonetes bacterium]|nr:glycosyltransferase [Candidatus Cloacimonadota bacterium]
FGLIGLEAFSHAKPVAAFRVGGIGEWLKHRENGTLVEPGNVTGLARAITELVSVPDLCRKYGLAGYELVNSKYNTTAFYNSIYQPMIDIKDGK